MFRILLSADLPGITNTSLGDKERPKLNTLKPKDFQLNLIFKEGTEEFILNA